MKYGMNNYKREDDLVEENVALGDPEVIAEAQEAQGDIQEVVQLCDAMTEYADAGEDLQLLENEHKVQVQVMDGDYAVTNGEIKVMEEDDVTINVDAKELGEAVGNDEGEILTPESTDADADEASAKLENDMNAILSRINGSLLSSRFGNGVLSKKRESDFSLKGKRGYRARVEGIGEAGKKVWETIKSFFAKIWEFMKSLFERFTALFKSNKSILEGLKSKLEGMEDDDLSEFKDKGEPSQQLAILGMNTKLGDVAAKNIDKFKDDVKAVFSTKEGETIKYKGASLGDKSASAKITKLCDKLDAGKFEKINTKGEAKYFIGVSGEGAVFVFEDAGKFGTFSVKCKNVGSSEVTKKKGNMRDFLIDLCEAGIDLCDDLDGDLVKDAKRDFEDFQKGAEDFFKEMYDKDDDAKKSDALKTQQKDSRTIMTTAVSTFSKVIATVGNQPSQYVTAVRNGMSLSSKKKD